MTPTLQDFCRDAANLAYARRLIDGACELRRLDRDMRRRAEAPNPALRYLLAKERAKKRA